jgi:broad specificity phosphatase PhoE
VVDTVIHLVRHGVVHNPELVRYGRLPGFHLSERGRTQAEAAARWLRGRDRTIDAIVSSPLDRAVETAQIIAALAGGTVEIDERLIEASSQFDGLHKTAFLSPQHWARLRNPLRPSWGEPYAQVAMRMRVAIELARAAHPGGVVVIVSHQSPIWIARRAYESAGPPWLVPMRCAPGSITTLHFARTRFAGETYWHP